MDKHHRRRKIAAAQMLADQGFSGPQIARHSTVQMSNAWVYVNVEFAGRGGPDAPPAPSLGTLTSAQQPAVAVAVADPTRRRLARGAGLVAVGASVAGLNLYSAVASDSLSILETLQSGLIGIGAPIVVAMASNAYRHRRRKQR